MQLGLLITNNITHQGQRMPTSPYLYISWLRRPQCCIAGCHRHSWPWVHFLSRTGRLSFHVRHWIPSLLNILDQPVLSHLMLSNDVLLGTLGWSKPRYSAKFSTRIPRHQCQLFGDIIMFCYDVFNLRLLFEQHWLWHNIFALLTAELGVLYRSISLAGAATTLFSFHGTCGRTSEVPLDVKLSPLIAGVAYPWTYFPMSKVRTRVIVLWIYRSLIYLNQIIICLANLATWITFTAFDFFSQLDLDFIFGHLKFFMVYKIFKLRIYNLLC